MEGREEVKEEGKGSEESIMKDEARKPIAISEMVSEYMAGSPFKRLPINIEPSI